MQYYKLHQYSEAVSRYENLATSAEEEVDSDLLTNYYASSISDNKALEALHAYPQDADSVGDCFDLLFNVACAYISSGHIAQAEITLQNALELCRSVLSEDGLSEEEIATESTAISLQKTFVDILLGRASQRSLDECREVLKNRKKSDELMAVAANNLAVLRGDKVRHQEHTLLKFTYVCRTCLTHCVGCDQPSPVLPKRNSPALSSWTCVITDAFFFCT